MEVLDIVRTAATKSGVVSSFNPDEFPDDVLDAGKAALSDEILPSLNCDRTLDITVTSRIYTPINNRIVLKPFRQPHNDFILLGYSAYTGAELLYIPNGKWRDEIQRLHNGWADTWPENDFGDPLTLAIWSSDMQLIYGTAITSNAVYDANIDFNPMRVSSVLENTSRMSYQYVYREEFEQSLRTQFVPGIYTTEEYEDTIIILTHGSPQPKCVILPVPLQIVNQSDQHAGTIHAPLKFKRYLIDCTAVALSIMYGVSSQATMQQQAAVSYNLLKKNKTQPLHAANVCEQINDKLHAGRDRRYYANL